MKKVSYVSSIDSDIMSKETYYNTQIEIDNDYMTIMLHALENMSVFDDKRQENLIVLYNKLEEM